MSVTRDNNRLHVVGKRWLIQPPFGEWLFGPLRAFSLDRLVAESSFYEGYMSMPPSSHARALSERASKAPGEEGVHVPGLSPTKVTGIEGEAWTAPCLVLGLIF